MSRWFVLRMLVGSLLATSMLTWLACSRKLVMLGFIGVRLLQASSLAAMAWCLYVAMWLRRPPALISMGRHGMSFGGVLWRGFWLPWGEITGAHVREISIPFGVTCRTWEVCEIVLTDFDAAYHRASCLQKRMLRAARASQDGLLIRCPGQPISSESLALEIQARALGNGEGK